MLPRLIWTCPRYQDTDDVSTLPRGLWPCPRYQDAYGRGHVTKTPMDVSTLPRLLWACPRYQDSYGRVHFTKTPMDVSTLPRLLWAYSCCHNSHGRIHVVITPMTLPCTLKDNALCNDINSSRNRKTPSRPFICNGKHTPNSVSMDCHQRHNC